MNEPDQMEPLFVWVGFSDPLRSLEAMEAIGNISLRGGEGVERGGGAQLGLHRAVLIERNCTFIESFILHCTLNHSYYTTVTHHFQVPEQVPKVLVTGTSMIVNTIEMSCIKRLLLVPLMVTIEEGNYPTHIRV